MTGGYSLRARLLLAAAVVLIAFVAAAGIAVQRAHADTVRLAHYARLQSTIYLLLARAELDAQGALQMPAEFAEPLLSLPSSGLYAAIYNANRNELWRSGSSLAVNPPARTGDIQTGEWTQATVRSGERSYLTVSYAVRWTAGRQSVQLILTVHEDADEFDREIGVFARTLWMWLGAAALLLLIAQIVLLAWAMRPLRRLAIQVGRIESGTQSRIEGSFPSEVSGLTDNLNALIQQERVRQERYKEAMSFLAHSLKTPLAVLRNALGEPAQLRSAVEEQVIRMDEIVQHQLGRARAGGASRFAPAIPVEPVLRRVRDALLKVYADKGIAITISCAPQLSWRIDEGDLFEIAGNVMDNAAKWAKQQVAVAAVMEQGRLALRVEDDGPGFADTGTILQMHVRADERVPGHGVGLAIVDDLVKAHNGELRLSRSSMGGALVEIMLAAA